MGIRYEKDTLLNWINEMGKYLRLLVDKWEGKIITEVEIKPAYNQFFDKERAFFEEITEAQLLSYLSSLELEQIRPLAQLLMYDGLITSDKDFLRKAKVIFEYHMQSSGSFSFEDYGLIARIDQELKLDS